MRIRLELEVLPCLTQFVESFCGNTPGLLIAGQPSVEITKHIANAAGFIIPAPAPVKRKSLAARGREFLEQKRSPSLKLAEDTIKLYTVIVEEFITVCGKTLPEDITEADVIRYCDQLDKRYSDGVRARRYTSLRGFLFYCGLEPKRLITASVHKRLKSYEKKERPYLQRR